MFEFMFVAAIVMAIIIYRRGGLKLPAIAGLSRGIMSSSKVQKRTVAVFAAAVALAIIWWYMGSDDIVLYLTKYWMWILGAVVVGYLVLKERSLTKALVGTALVCGTIAVIIIGTHSQLTTGSVIPNGCSNEPIVVQTAQTSDDALSSGAFQLSPDCVLTLDVELLRLEAVAEGKTKFQPHVVRAQSNSKQIMSQREARLYGVSSITWVNGRPMFKVMPNPRGFQEAGISSIDLEVLTPNQAKDAALLEAALK